jgi:carbonic anhydrase/acetyltransferase-like protein (isoleucine patch superfamily)
MIKEYLGTRPTVHPDAWIADDAVVIGDVVVAKDASIWFQTVVRGDVSHIRIGARSNIQDHCTLHVTRDAHPCIIHDDVTVGHRVVLHGCEVMSGALVGIGSIVLDNAVIEEGAMVGAMSLVTPGMRVPAGQLVMGQPARVVRAVKDAERQWMAETVKNYMGYANDYKRGR